MFTLHLSSRHYHRYLDNHRYIRHCTSRCCHDCGHRYYTYLYNCYTDILSHWTLYIMKIVVTPDTVISVYVSPLYRYFYTRQYYFLFQVPLIHGYYFTGYRDFIYLYHRYMDTLYTVISCSYITVTWIHRYTCVDCFYIPVAWIAIHIT